MTPDEIVCRLCGKDYGIPEGCAVCTDAKRNIVWPAMQTSENADLVKVSRRVVKMLDKQCRAIEKELDAVYGGVFHKELVREASLLARAIGSILTEARKLEEAEEKRVKQGGFDDQLGIFIEWLAGLPREFQHKALGSMERLLLGPGEEGELVD